MFFWLRADDCDIEICTGTAACRPSALRFNETILFSNAAGDMAIICK